MSVETITLGCRLNFAESETMKRLASGKTTIINSCVVTAEAQRQTRVAIPLSRARAAGGANRGDELRGAAVDRDLSRDSRCRCGRTARFQRGSKNRFGFSRAGAQLRRGSGGVRSSLYSLHHLATIATW